MGERETPEEQVRRLYEEAESSTAKAMEELVQRDAFGELLARTTENLVAVVKIGNDVMDSLLRNLRVAGRRDVTRLGEQLNRTEDKLELVLQHLERVEDELREEREERERPAARGRSRTTGGSGRSPNGRGTSASRRRTSSDKK
jgi:hypothetical protein